MESKAVVAIVVTTLLACTAFVVITSSDHSDVGSTSPITGSTDLYTLAGFRVVTSYKCIFPTCTDFWCNANCNHHPAYCPASFCRKVTTRIPVPTPKPTEAPSAPPTSANTEKPPAPTDSPTDEPTPAPTFAPTCQQSNIQPDMSQCHPACTSGGMLTQAERIKQTGRGLWSAPSVTGQVTTDQCTNCFCAGCADSMFTGNCGGVRPTAAACSELSCCPDTCRGGEMNVKPQSCNDPKCCACAPALFEHMCGGYPDTCPATTELVSTTELASSVPSCDAVGKSGLCDTGIFGCVSQCRGDTPGFKVPGCVEQDYCTGSAPSWADGSVCSCPPTPAPKVPTCDAADKSELCKTACSSTCRGSAPGFKVAGCADQSYCDTPPAWAASSVCMCPSNGPPPPPAPPTGACKEGLEGRVAHQFVQSVGGSSVCCPESCGTCGGAECASRPGGKSECCVGDGTRYGITASGVSCSTSGPPCIVMGDATTELVEATELVSKPNVCQHLVNGKLTCCSKDSDCGSQGGACWACGRSGMSFIDGGNRRCSTCAAPASKGAPCCDVVGQGSLCHRSCSSTCRGFAPAFAAADCVTDSYCPNPPSWAKGSVCKCC